MKLSDPNKEIGVWRAIWRLGGYRFSEVVWPEGLIALLLGGGGAALALRGTDLQVRVDAMGEVLPFAGALLAVVFAALAIVVSLPSMSYLRMLQETPEGGMRRFLDPFLVAVGVQITIILLALAYSLAAENVAWRIEHVAFYVLGFLFVFGLLDIASLARQLVRHGILRAVDASIEEDQDEPKGGSVRRLPDRRRPES